MAGVDPSNPRVVGHIKRTKVVLVCGLVAMHAKNGPKKITEMQSEFVAVTHIQSI